MNGLKIEKQEPVGTQGDYEPTAECKARPAGSEISQLRDLVQHCWVHSGYQNCGYNQMEAEQRQLFDSITDIEDHLPKPLTTAEAEQALKDVPKRPADEVEINRIDEAVTAKESAALRLPQRDCELGVFHGREYRWVASEKSLQYRTAIEGDWSRSSRLNPGRSDSDYGTADRLIIARLAEQAAAQDAEDAVKQLETTCPKCGNSRANGIDRGEDRDDDGNLINEWLECGDCGNQWNYVKPEAIQKPTGTPVEIVAGMSIGQIIEGVSTRLDILESKVGTAYLDAITSESQTGKELGDIRAAVHELRTIVDAMNTPAEEPPKQDHRREAARYSQRWIAKHGAAAHEQNEQMIKAEIEKITAEWETPTRQSGPTCRNSRRLERIAELRGLLAEHGEAKKELSPEYAAYHEEYGAWAPVQMELDELRQQLAEANAKIAELGGSLGLLANKMRAVTAERDELRTIVDAMNTPAEEPPKQDHRREAARYSQRWIAEHGAAKAEKSDYDEFINSLSVCTREELIGRCMNYYFAIDDVDDHRESLRQQFNEANAKIESLTKERNEYAGDCGKLNQMVRDTTGQGQGAIDAYVAQCELVESLTKERDEASRQLAEAKERLAEANRRLAEWRVATAFDTPQKCNRAISDNLAYNSRISEKLTVARAELAAIKLVAATPTLRQCVERFCAAAKEKRLNLYTNSTSVASEPSIMMNGRTTTVDSLISALTPVPQPPKDDAVASAVKRLRDVTAGTATTTFEQCWRDWAIIEKRLEANHAE